MLVLALTDVEQILVGSAVGTVVGTALGLGILMLMMKRWR